MFYSREPNYSKTRKKSKSNIIGSYQTLQKLYSSTMINKYIIYMLKLT